MPPLLRLVHPFPSALNALVVFGIASLAGAPFHLAGQLALAMLGLQFCIGAVNDLYDEELDALAKPAKPIPSGRVSRRTAWLVAVVTGSVGLCLAAAARPPDLVPLTLAGIMLGAGLAYDVWLKPTAFGWICFAIALPVLPLYAWYGAIGTLPPRAELLVPVAALAGLGLQLANSLIDVESDARGGAQTLAVWLGRRRALTAMAAAVLAIHFISWLTLPDGSPAAAALLSGAAGALACGGLVASAQGTRLMREIGWSAQAGSVAVLAIAWLLGAAS